jgi:hypothetical protein
LLDTPGLLDLLRDLQRRDPAQFDSEDLPRGSEAKKLQAEIDEVGDPSSRLPRIEQARRVEARAKADVEAFVADNLDGILDGLGPEAEKVAVQANERAQDLSDALDSYIGFQGRVSALVATAGRDTRSVPGLDAAAQCRRTAQEVHLPAPIPE